MMGSEKRENDATWKKRNSRQDSTGEMGGWGGGRRGVGGGEKGGRGGGDNGREACWERRHLAEEKGTHEVSVSHAMWGSTNPGAGADPSRVG